MQHVIIAGLDLQCAGEVIFGDAENADVARKAFYLHNVVSKFQDSFNVLEKVVCLYAVFLYFSIFFSISGTF